MISFTSSAPIRSGVIRSISPAIAVIAATTRGAGVNDSWEANLAARSIRSGSSRNDFSGVPGVSSTRWASCSEPTERVGELVRRATTQPSR